MHLSISTTHKPATDLGFLLYKHPKKLHTRGTSFSTNHCFFSEATDDLCTANLWVNVRELQEFELYRRFNNFENPFINDRPYVAGSLMSTAMSEMFRTAMSGSCRERPELARSPIPLTIEVATVRCEDGIDFIKGIFEPLGYQVDLESYLLDEAFPNWGSSPYFKLRLQTNKELYLVLRQLFILLPVLDNQKHYWVDEAEQEKIIKMGEGWLQAHPMFSKIVSRYLKNLQSLAVEVKKHFALDENLTTKARNKEEQLEQKIHLNTLRMDYVAELLKDHQVRTVGDLGCGEGKLIERLLQNSDITEIRAFEVSIDELEKAQQRIAELKQLERVKFFNSSVLYLDHRTKDLDAVVLVEVIEHLEEVRLPVLAANVFKYMEPSMVVITTPNFEFNQRFETKGFRHPDHRFEWTREEFKSWCEVQAQKYGYTFKIDFIGEVDSALGGPTQVGVFIK